MQNVHKKGKGFNKNYSMHLQIKYGYNVMASNL